MRDCLIVGGGIGGAVLARLLGRQGKSALILEREKLPPHAGRPELLAGATHDILEPLLGARLKSAALLIRGLELTYRGKALLEFRPDEFDEAGARLYSTDPYAMRQMLLENARGTEVRRGVEVTGLLREGGRVRGVTAKSGGQEPAFEAPLVVGDDGTHSRIRQALDIPLKLTEFPIKFLVPKDFLPKADAAARGRAHLDFTKLKKGVMGALFMPIPGERSAFLFGMSQETYERLKGGPARFYEEAETLVPAEFRAAWREKFKFPEDYVLIDRSFGHAKRYGAQGAALLGDAAHPVTPVGGQGANLSVHDGATLAGCEGDLEKYERLRRPAAERSLSFSGRASAAFHALMAFPPMALAVPGVLSRIGRKERLNLIRAVTTAFLDGP